MNTTTDTTIVRIPGHFYEWLMDAGWDRAKIFVSDSSGLDSVTLALVFGQIARALDGARVIRHGHATVRHTELDARSAFVLNRMARVRAELNNGPGNPAHLRAARTVMDRTADALEELTAGQ